MSGGKTATLLAHGLQFAREGKTVMIAQPNGPDVVMLNTETLAEAKREKVAEVVRWLRTLPNEATFNPRTLADEIEATST